MKIKSIKIKETSETVYNIGVKDNNNYFASGVLVHNCYVEAGPGGHDSVDPCSGWKRFIETFPEDKRLEVKDIKEDSILSELLGKIDPSSEKPDLEVLLLRAKIKLALLEGRGITKTHKPFQIAIGK